MSDTARTDDVRITKYHRASSRPHLEVLPGGQTAERAPNHNNGEPNPGRSGLIGYALGFTVTLVGISIAGTLGGMGIGPSVGLGAFVGMWGGGGFGFMLGATIPLARHLEGNHTHARHQGEHS